MNELAVTVFLIIVPGIIATLVVLNLTIHKPFSNFFFSLYSLVLGIFSYIFLQLFMWLFIWIKNLIRETCFDYSFLNTWKVIGEKSINSIEPSEIIYASLISIPLSFAVSLVINKKLLHKFAQLIKISNKYGDENLFYYYLNSEEVDWVYIRDKRNDFIYQGRVATYSENDKIQEIVLTEVSVYNFFEPKEVIFTTPTIYLSRPVGSFQIEQIPYENFNNNNNEGE